MIRAKIQQNSFEKFQSLVPCFHHKVFNGSKVMRIINLLIDLRLTDSDGQLGGGGANLVADLAGPPTAAAEVPAECSSLRACRQHYRNNSLQKKKYLYKFESS